MPLLIRNSFSLAKRSIRRHRIRSFLTCLGIAIGVASITLIFSLIGGINSLLSNTTDSDSLVVIRPRSVLTDVDQFVSELTHSSASLAPSLTLTDFDNITKNVKNLSASAPISLSATALTSGDYSAPATPVLATTPDFKTVSNLSISTGVFLSSSTPKNALILGNTLASTLFGNTSPVGRTVSLFGEKFIILGVLAPVSNPINFNNVNLDKSAIVDINFLSTLNTVTSISQIDLLVSETSLISDTKKEIKDILTVTKSDSTSFDVLSSTEIANPSTSLLSIVSSILALIAAISLIVGGVGVSNMMFVTITERTHEIGIKKATGATSFNILSEFLLEAIMISLGGGILGILLGLIFAAFISFLTPLPVFISLQIVLISLATAILTGTIFGFIPAHRAAKKDPIRSLKTYY